MGTYENKIGIESCIKTIHKQQCTEHKVQSMIDELEMVYDKAKAFDAIVNIQDDFVEYHGFYPCVEEYAEEVEDIINEYTEDKQNGL